MTKSKKTLLLFWGLAVLFDVIDVYVINNSTINDPFSVFTSVTLSFIMFAWFMADAAELNLKPSYGLKVAIVAFGYFALPYYLIRYKGWVRGCLAMIKFLVYLFAYFFIAILLRRYLKS